MTKIANRISSRTTFAWGLANAPVGLFKTSGKPDADPEFVTAGPHGCPLEKAPVKNGKRLPNSEPERPVTAPVLTDAPLDVAPVLADDAPTEEPVKIGLLEQGYDEELDPERDVRRGLRVLVEDDGEETRFIDLTDPLAEIDRETVLEEMRVIGFVRRERVPRHRVVGSYFLGGDGAGAPKLLRLLLEAMTRRGRVAVVKWSKRTTQSLGVIVPGGRGALTVLELEFAENVRRPGPKPMAHLQAEVRESEVAAAMELLDAMADAPAILDEQRDERAMLRRDLAERAVADELVGFVVPVQPNADEDLTLEQMLERSIEHVR